MKKAILLLNLGTPAGPSQKDVKSYLSEFLMDPDVISVPYPIRYFLVNGLIAPLRSKSSAKKYQSIWTDEGSPLLVFSEHINEKLGKSLKVDPNQNIEIKSYLCMRYGEPSISSVVQQMMADGIDEILLFPLYPQFADATTGTGIKAFKQVISKLKFAGKVQILESYFDDDRYIEACTNHVKDYLSKNNLENSYDHFLFSFHGLPEKQVKSISPGYCLVEKNCCENICEKNKYCYKSHCINTANLISKKLDLKKTSISFQSRLGPVEWIKPYTSDTVIELAKSGLKNIAVFCPSFTVDCLETLEEIQIEVKEEFIENGGETFHYIPCLNSQPDWIDFIKLKSLECFSNDKTNTKAKELVSP